MATDSQKIQTLIKRAYNVPSTYDGTEWYNEKSGLHQTTLEANDINVQTPPEVPTWGDDAQDELIPNLSQNHRAPILTRPTR